MCIDPVRCRSLGPNAAPAHTPPLIRHKKRVDKGLFARFGRYVVLLLYWALGGLTAIMDGNKSTN
ncbi:hypothetical protein [Micromonospora violae]|nr:hypothetical protein [Micromonospora violae]